MSFSVKPHFLGSFKTGDNINYNLRTLRCLYYFFEMLEGDLLDHPHHASALIKPIVIINISITEALLYDFIEYRIKTTRPIDQVFSEIGDLIRQKELDDKFSKYIDQAQKHSIFGEKQGLYKLMRELNEKRNRVHIQNTRHYKPIDEKDVFTNKVKVESEGVLEKVLLLASKWPRNKYYQDYVKDFKLPWNKHFPDEWKESGN